MTITRDARARALEVAKAIIGGRTTLVRGVRELEGLHHAICSDPLSPTLLPILAAAHDARELQLDGATHQLSREESDALLRGMARVDNLHREAVLSACRALVRKLECR